MIWWLEYRPSVLNDFKSINLFPKFGNINIIIIICSPQYVQCLLNTLQTMFLEKTLLKDVILKNDLIKTQNVKERCWLAKEHDQISV